VPMRESQLQPPDAGEQKRTALNRLLRIVAHDVVDRLKITQTRAAEVEGFRRRNGELAFDRVGDMPPKSVESTQD